MGYKDIFISFCEQRFLSEDNGMTRTIVASATREIVIGFDQPFCVIGERINPTGRKKLAAEMIEGNFETVKKDALEQAAAGSIGLM